MTAMAATVQGSSWLDSGEGRSIHPDPSSRPCVQAQVGVVCASVPRELGACAVLFLALAVSCTRGGGNGGAAASPPAPVSAATTADRSSPAAVPAGGHEACDTGISAARTRAAAAETPILTAGTAKPEAPPVAPPGMVWIAG